MKNLKIVLTIVIITLICVSAVYEILRPKKTIEPTAGEKEEVTFWSLQMGTFGNYMNPIIEEFESRTRT